MSYPLLIFSEGISFGHIARTLIISKWLKELELPIIVACPDFASTLFEAIDIQAIGIKIANPKDIYQRLRKGVPMYTLGELLGYFEQDELLITSLKPRLIVSEFRFTALQIAKKYQIPSVSLIDATCHPNFIPEGTVPDPFAKPNFISLKVLDFIAQKTLIGSFINKLTIKKISSSLREASIAYGLEPLATFFDYASQGDICLICDHPELVPIKPLRSSDIYTGAMLWKRNDPLPEELKQLDPNCKTVYICPGTQESLSTEFLSSYIKELLKQNLQVIVSRGNRDISLTEIDKNLFVFDFINENKLLSKVDVMIYPGGAMSTYQALSCGVPLIVLPAHANQHFYAEIITSRQLGIFFRPSRLEIETLVKNTMNLIKDSTTKEEIGKLQPRLVDFTNREVILRKIKNLLDK